MSKTLSTEFAIESLALMSHHVFIVQVFHGKSFSARAAKEFVVSEMVNHVVFQGLFRAERFLAGAAYVPPIYLQ